MKQPVERIQNTMGLNESLELHIAGWKIQRIGWVLILIFVLLALLGLFGTGMLSTQKVEHSGNRVEYERYGRFENSTNMHFVATSENGRASLYLPQQFLQIFEVEKITPEPDRQEALNGFYRFTFLANAPVHILLRGKPEKTGNVEVIVRVNNAQFLLSQYIFP